MGVWGYGVFYNTITGRREVVGAAKNLPQKFKNHLFAALTIGELYSDTIFECREFLDQQGLERTAKQIRDKVRNLIGRI